jgi:hypothetical protein
MPLLARIEPHNEQCILCLSFRYPSAFRRCSNRTTVLLSAPLDGEGKSRRAEDPGQERVDKHERGHSLSR